MDLSYIDPQVRVLNYCYKQEKHLSNNAGQTKTPDRTFP